MRIDRTDNLGSFTPTRGMFGNEPFCIAYVYGENGNLIVRGMDNQVGRYLDGYTQRYVAYLSFWKRGVSRGYWTSNCDLNWVKNGRVGGRITNGWCLIHNGVSALRVKRIPNRWIPLYTSLLAAPTPTPVVRPRPRERVSWDIAAADFTKAMKESVPKKPKVQIIDLI